MKGYLAMPADAAGTLPAVVVVHENRGLNPHIKDVTRRMALEGFVALGVDLLSRQGGTPATDEEAARDVPEHRPRRARARRRRGDRLSSRACPTSNGKVGAIGFCFGGGIVNQMAVASPDLAAGVAYYGGQPTAAASPRSRRG